MHPKMSYEIAFFNPSIGAEEIENLTKFVDNRLVMVLSNNGNYVNM